MIFAEENPFVCDCNFVFTLAATDVHNLVQNIRTIIDLYPCASPTEYSGLHYAELPLLIQCGGKFQANFVKILTLACNVLSSLSWVNWVA